MSEPSNHELNEKLVLFEKKLSFAYDAMLTLTQVSLSAYRAIESSDNSEKNQKLQAELNVMLGGLKETMHHLSNGLGIADSDD